MTTMLAAPSNGARLDPTASSVARVVGYTVGLCALATMPLLPWLLAMDGYHVLLTTAHASVCAVGVVVAVHHRLRPCLLVGSLFPYCWLVLPSAYQISHGQAAWGDPGVTVDFSATLRAQLILLLGQLSLLLVYAIATSRSSARVGAAHADATTWDVTQAGRNRMFVLAAVLAFGAVLLVPYVASSAGGFSALFTSRDSFNAALADQGLTADDNATRALIRTVPSGLAISAIVLALWLVRHSPVGDRMRLRAGTLAGGTLLVLFVVANPFVSSRYVVLAAFGTVAMAFFLPRSRTAAIAWFLALIFAFLLAYPAASLFRSENATVSSDPILASKDFDGFQQAINTVTYVDRHGTSKGIHVVSGLLFFVPRGIWTGKAVPSTFPVAEERGYVFQNLSMPLPAEAYLDGGWPGVVLLLGGVGLIFSWFDRAWLDQSRSSIITAYLAVAQVGLWRGPFGSLAPVFGFTIALLLVAVIVSGDRRGRHATARSRIRRTRPARPAYH